MKTNFTTSDYQALKEKLGRGWEIHYEGRTAEFLYYIIPEKYELRVVALENDEFEILIFFTEDDVFEKDGQIKGFYINDIVPFVKNFIELYSDYAYQTGDFKKEPSNLLRLIDLCEARGIDIKNFHPLIKYYETSLGWTRDEAINYCITLFESGTVEEILKLGGKDNGRKDN